MVRFESYSLVLAWRFHLVNRASENINTTDLQMALMGRKTECPGVNNISKRAFLSSYLTRLSKCGTFADEFKNQEWEEMPGTGVSWKSQSHPLFPQILLPSF